MADHRIDEDIRPLELEAGDPRGWVDAGLADLEGFLAKHAAFLDYLDTRPKE